MAGRKFQIGNASLFIVKKDYYLCMWMTKLAGKKQNLDPMWTVFNKEVDLGEPTSFLGLNREFLLGEVEKLPVTQNLRISSWSYDMAGHAKKCVE